MYYVYVLRNHSTNPLFYVGVTDDVNKRLIEHNLGLSKWTSSAMPWRVMYYEAFSESLPAYQREKQLKQHGKAWQELKKRIGA